MGTIYSSSPNFIASSIMGNDKVYRDELDNDTQSSFELSSHPIIALLWIIDLNNEHTSGI